MKKIFDNRYFFEFVVILLVFAYFFEYLLSGLIINIILLLFLELAYDIIVLYISLKYISKSSDFKQNTWIKPKAGMYILIVLISLFTIKTIYDLITELFL